MSSRLSLCIMLIEMCNYNTRNKRVRGVAATAVLQTWYAFDMGVNRRQTIIVIVTALHDNYCTVSCLGNVETPPLQRTERNAQCRRVVLIDNAVCRLVPNSVWKRLYLIVQNSVTAGPNERQLFRRYRGIYGNNDGGRGIGRLLPCTRSEKRA